MRWLMWFVRSLFCRHEWRFVENLYGDKIIWSGGNRSLWQCVKCERCQGRPELYNKEPA
jgi:hypothetical protein